MQEIVVRLLLNDDQAATLERETELRAVRLADYLDMLAYETEHGGDHGASEKSEV